MQLGVHISIGKGFPAALKQAQGLGCDGMQIFAGNPRGWARKPIPENETAQFRKIRQELGLWPIMVHLSYLPNVATANPDLYEKSVTALAEDLRRANQLGADFFVFHPGQAKGLPFNEALERVIKTINFILEQVSGPTLLLFENQAGKGSDIAACFDDLGRLIHGVADSKRVGVCLDTCHAFAAGYDLASPSGWQNTLDQFDSKIGLEHLKIFHLNDAAGTLGSGLDRHQHIGLGNIGLAGFSYLLNHPQLSHLPGILETPQDTPEDDLKNLAALRELVKRRSS